MSKLIIAITRGLIRNQHTRRTTMFVILVAALLMLFCGATFLLVTLTEHPLAFVCYWVACAWLTLSATLLALFDLLTVRAQAWRERQRLKAEITNAPTNENV
jgi:hypothetical protein